MTDSDRRSVREPRCKACQHPAAAEIDTALAGGTAAAVVARAHGLAPRAVVRHAERHLPAALAKAQDAADVAHGGRLLARVENLQARTLAILGRAEAEGEPMVALRAVAEARRNLELLARVSGEARADGPGLSLVVYQSAPVIPAVIRPAEPGELDGEW